MDVRFGTERAVIGQPEVAMGILPGAGGTARWPRLVGRSRALDILLTGRDVGAAELLALGWLLAVGPPQRGPGGAGGVRGADSEDARRRRWPPSSVCSTLPWPTSTPPW